MKPSPRSPHHAPIWDWEGRHRVQPGRVDGFDLPDYRARRDRTPMAAALCLFLTLTGLVVLVAACGAGGQQTPGDGTSANGAFGGKVLTIEQAMASKPGEPISVSGAIVATGSSVDAQIVLASVLLESYPPQAGGAVLPVAGLDLASLVGLNSTVGQADYTPVTWSDYWVVLRGVVEEGVLQAQGVPEVVEATAGGLRVRFSPVSGLLQSDATAWWAFDIRNEATEAVDLVFSSGQRADVVLSQNGVEKYRWSGGKAFTQAIETATIRPGETVPIVLNDELTVEPGRYDLTAMITATFGSEGAEQQPLPVLALAVTVY